MILTGKAKDLFKQYYEKLTPHTPNHITYSTFMGLHSSLQWGIYQDWADSIGYDMITEANTEQTSYWFTIYGQEYISDVMFKTRQEARDAAIEKLNDLINEQ